MSFGVNAQNNTNVRRVEFEIGTGVIMGHKIDGTTSEGGMQLFFETRLNLDNTPFDVGLQALFGYVNRQGDIYGRDHETRYQGLMATFVDYNYRRWKRVALFGGIGVGFAAVNHDISWVESGRITSALVYDRSFVLNPRIGVELFNHLRFTLEYKLMKREYSFFGLSIGGVFGGGYKK